MKDKIASFIQKAAGAGVPVEVFVPEHDTFGHYGTNVALKLAKETRRNPLEVAGEFIPKVRASAPDGFFEKIEAAPPGFINFWVSADVLRAGVREIIAAGEAYALPGTWEGKKVRIEYVSANPTGPLHVGNARGGPFGEVLARVYERLGAKVLREYIHNDAGTQVEKMGQTLWHWYCAHLGREAAFPEGGYQGEYLKEIAALAVKELGPDLTDADLPKLTAFGLDRIFAENIETVRRMGINFDLIVKESELIASGKTAAAVEFVKGKGVTREKDGALWFAPQDEFLKDRESVIIRSSGQPTYFASDIAYHREKFTSGCDLVIDVLGSNHHGHVPKLRALTNIFGFDPARFVVLLYQYVRVKRGAEVVKMSKRAGTYVTASEVLDEVGSDNFIFFLLLHSQEAHMDFDLALAKKRSMENPVYYAQYAYVRARNILAKCGDIPPSADLAPLATPEDKDLMRALLRFGEAVEDVSRDYRVNRLAQYATGLARVFHNWYEKERVVGEAEPLMRARAALVQATATVLKNLFDIVGVSAPEKM